MSRWLKILNAGVAKAKLRKISSNRPLKQTVKKKLVFKRKSQIGCYTKQQEVVPFVLPDGIKEFHTLDFSPIFKVTFSIVYFTLGLSSTADIHHLNRILLQNPFLVV